MLSSYSKAVVRRKGNYGILLWSVILKLWTSFKRVLNFSNTISLKIQLILKTTQWIICFFARMVGETVKIQPWGTSWGDQILYNDLRFLMQNVILCNISMRSNSNCFLSLKRSRTLYWTENAQVRWRLQTDPPTWHFCSSLVLFVPSRKFSHKA